MRLTSGYLADRKNPLKVQVDLDVDRQLISVTDNAGGVKEEDLRLLVAPGGSRNEPGAEVIGVFGVGSKRAGIALGEQVLIRTRFAKGPTFEIDITKDWLESEDWRLPAYQVPDIVQGTTQVDVSHLRNSFSQRDVEDLIVHLGETYDWFLREGCVIEVNRAAVTPRNFEKWAFPPGFVPKPRHLTWTLAVARFRLQSVPG